MIDSCYHHCERMPTCTACHRAKTPVGRSPPMEMARSLCDHECPGYRNEPTPGHLWPGELDSRAENSPRIRSAAEKGEAPSVAAPEAK